MKRLFLSLALALAFAASAFGGDAYYRVFYYVSGEHRERPYQHTTLASSEEECRRQVLEQVPKAYKFEINRLDWPVEPAQPKGHHGLPSAKFFARIGQNGHIRSRD